MKRLRELTAELSLAPFPTGVCAEAVAGEWVEYPMERGTCLARNLYSRDEISTAVWLNTNGSVFPEHAHKQHEIIWVFRGCMHLYVDEGGVERKFILKPPGGFYYLAPGTSHRAEFPLDTWYIASTQPKSEDWPT
jgi:quercetin dioxygenase-like cupin family protein